MPATSFCMSFCSAHHLVYMPAIPFCSSSCLHACRSVYLPTNSFFQYHFLYARHSVYMPVESFFMSSCLHARGFILPVISSIPTVLFICLRIHPACHVIHPHCAISFFLSFYLFPPFPLYARHFVLPVILSTPPFSFTCPLLTCLDIPSINPCTPLPIIPDISTHPLLELTYPPHPNIALCMYLIVFVLPNPPYHCIYLS